MLSYQYILFDLDGTLTDSKLGIVNSVKHALKQFDIEENDEDRLNFIIGPSLYDSFPHLYGFDENKTHTAVTYFRDYFKSRGIFENELFPGVREMLTGLKEKKLFVALVTSKPQVFAKRILEHFKLLEYFDVIKGSELDGTRTHKKDLIEEVLADLPRLDRKQVVMIGDRMYDIEGAHACEIASIGVLYGYGTIEELSEHRPTHIVKDIAELQLLLAQGD